MKRICTLIVLLCAAISGFAQKLTVEAPTVVTVDETFRIVFTAEGRMSDFDWPGSGDFTIVWGPQSGSMSSTSIVNGKRTSTHQETRTYLMQATKEGKFTLPGATATVDKENIASRSFTIEVVGSAQQNRNQGQSQDSQQQQGGQNQDVASGTISNNDIFLKMTLSKSSVVKGEPLIATLKLYTRADIAGFEDIHFPTFNGFWSREVDTPQNIEFNRENVNGTIYNAALLRRYMLIPQQTGSLTIEPAEMVCQLRVRTAPSSPRSFFDDFFDSYQTIRKRLSTSQLKVNVKPLPAGAPASFGGGVGDFKISASFSKDALKAHEASSLVVTVSGKGNMSMLEAPKVDFPSDFEVYDIKTSEKISADGTSGSKTFEYPFIPRSHGDFKVGPVLYSYYDIAKGEYKTLSSGDLPITVEKGEDVTGGGVVMPGISRQGVKNLAEDIRYITTGSAGLKRDGHFFAGSLAFYIAVTAIVVLFFIASALLKAAALRRKDVVGSKNRKANKMARLRLKQAGEYLKQNISGAFYEEMHKALLGYVSDKLAIPAADLSKDRISEVLGERGVDAGLTGRLLELLDECDFARYAPESARTSMTDQYENAVNIISELEGQVKNSDKSKKGGRTAAFLLLFCLSSGALYADNDVSTLWSAGNDAYAGGDWQSALNYYNTISGEGLSSAALYYNIANCHFKLNDIPHSILYYEKALKADPSYADAQHNLAIAQEFTLDKIEELPEFLLAGWVDKVKYLLPADGWAWSSVVLAFAVALLMLGFRFFSSVRGRKIAFVCACIVALFTVVTFIFSVSQKSAALQQESAIVMQPVVQVKSSPGEAGKSIFVIHEGTKVRLKDSVGEWTKIEIADGRQGWVTGDLIEKI